MVAVKSQSCITTIVITMHRTAITIGVRCWREKRRASTGSDPESISPIPRARVGCRCAASSLPLSGVAIRHHLVADDLDPDARQRPAGRPRGRSPAFQVEAAVVARALEALLAHTRDDGAGEVRAGLVEGHEPALVQPYQDADVALRRIAERERPADGQLGEAGDLLQRRLAATPAPSVLRHDPELPARDRRADQDHEAGEVAARDVLVRVDADREVAPPARLLGRGAPVGGDGSVRAGIAVHGPTPSGAQSRTSSIARSGSSSARVAGVRPASTSKACSADSRGTITFTFVVIVWAPNWNSSTGRERGRRRSISSRVP